eukprot:gene2403-2867_t
MGGLMSTFVFQAPNPATYKDQKLANIIWIPCNQTEIPCLFQKVEDSDECILISHGTSTDLGEMSKLTKRLCERLKVNVLSYEYLGYGVDKNNRKPSTKPSEKGVYDSIEAALNYLKNQLNFKEEKIILFGKSLGTAPTVYLASKEESKFAGVILQSPFLSIVRTVIPIKQTLFFDMFLSQDRIHKIESPVFIIHGKADEVVPFYHGQVFFELFKKCKNPHTPLFIDGAGHSNIMKKLTVDLYFYKLNEFYEAVSKGVDKTEKREEIIKENEKKEKNENEEKNRKDVEIIQLESTAETSQQQNIELPDIDLNLIESSLNKQNHIIELPDAELIDIEEENDEIENVEIKEEIKVSDNESETKKSQDVEIKIIEESVVDPTTTTTPPINENQSLLKQSVD